MFVYFFRKLSRGVLNQRVKEREKKKIIREEEKLKRYHKNLLNPSLPPIGVEETIDVLETSRPGSRSATPIPGQGPMPTSRKVEIAFVTTSP